MSRQSDTPCRLCGHPVWSDNGLDVHPCCLSFELDIRAGGHCGACASSAALNRRNGVDVPWGKPLPGYPLP